MHDLSFSTILILAIDWVLRIGLSLRVIMRRRPVGVSLAWISVILAVPLIGSLIYLMFGELRLGRSRALRAQQIHGPYQAWLESLRQRYPHQDDDAGDRPPSLARMVESASGFPPLAGNTVELIDSTEASFQWLISDIDKSQTTCHLEFYIWSTGGWADEVVEALCRARQRGVVVRVLVDAVGSAAFLGSVQAERLRAAGVELHAALPVKLWRLLFSRFDLRLHRKIAVIDGRIAYTGSMNIADPRYFKRDAGVGQWVDAMARVRGPAVEALAVTFIEDWELETGHGLESIVDEVDLRDQPMHGQSHVQVIPSGPNVMPDAMKAVVLQAAYSARTELVMTTPYFVPD
jgi:cardiolipin synthase